MEARLETRLETVKKLIAEVQKDIDGWRRYQSQSNPSAAADLREMKRELNGLLKIRKELEQILQENSLGAQE